MQDPGDAWKFAELGSLKGVLMAAANAGKFIPDPMIPFDREPREDVSKLCSSLLHLLRGLCAMT